MSSGGKIIAFAGSLRRESFNKCLVKIAAAAAERAGADVEYLNLKDYPLPIYDGDLEDESGIPENAIALKKKWVAADGFLISSPEYNSSISAALKNAIDWVSRPQESEPPLVAFKGKVAVLMAASLGGLGGLRGLVHVRAILGNIGVIVLPDQAAISQAHEAFAADGSLKNKKQQSKIEDLGRTLAETIRKLRASLA